MIADKFFSRSGAARGWPGSWLLIRPGDEAVQLTLLGAAGWQDISPAALPAPSRFSRHILLLPDDQCLFQHRTFPLELLSQADLDEAITLDMARWLPAREPYDKLYFASREDAHWSVSVWAWPQAVAEEAMQQLPAGLRCTHIMPGLAWLAISLQPHAPALLVCADGPQQHYAFIDASGMPRAVATVNSAESARHFCRAYMGRIPAGHLFVSGEAAPYWPSEQFQPMPAEPPRIELLNQARCSGVVEWSDPLAWKKPIVALLAAVLLWMAGDAVAVALASRTVTNTLKATAAEAGDILQKRQHVAALSSRLNRIIGFQQQQRRPEAILAGISALVPEDIWLSIVQVNRQWVDLSGQGKDVARLTVLLESLPGVKQVLLMGAIHPDARTGLETFQLRLMLAEQGPS